MTTAVATDRARFQELMGNADAWNSIDKLVELCDEADFWSEEFTEGALASAKKSQVRRLIRTLKDDESWPLWANVETTGEDGKTERTYKQELMFDSNDYRQVVDYHNERSAHHSKMRDGYAARCKRRFDIQIPLPFGNPADPQKPR